MSVLVPPGSGWSQHYGNGLKDTGEGKCSWRGLQAVPVVVRCIEMETEVQKYGSTHFHGMGGLAG